MLDGLDAATEYRVQFQAINSVGTGLRSPAAFATTDVALTAPVFSDDTGDDQSWTQNQPITSLTVPAANGNPTPTYAAVGTLPAGIAFNTTTRVVVRCADSGWIGDHHHPSHQLGGDGRLDRRLHDVVSPRSPVLRRRHG